MLKINAISMVELFHQKRKQMILFPCTLFCYCLFDMDFIYALIYIDIIFLDTTITLNKYLIMEDR